MKIALLSTLLLLVHFVQAQTDLNAGLIAYYPFNGNANDESGNGHNPSVVKATFTSDRLGKPNSACQFNGTSNFIRIPDDNAFHFNNGFSISAWVSIKGVYGGLCHGNRILMKGYSDLAYSGNYMLAFDDNHYTQGRNCEIATPDRSHQNFYGMYTNNKSNNYIVPNKWYLLTYVFDGTNALLYVDCKLQEKGSAKDQGFSNSYDIFLGKMDNDQYPYWFNGLLDELRIYDRPLNENEISALCNKIPEAAQPPKVTPVATTAQLNKRDKEVIKTIAVENDSVNIALYDNGIIDGDSITLIYNDEIILTHHLLSDKPIKFSLKINPDRTNELVMYAENLGSIPPNTALAVIVDGKNRYELNLSSNQVKNQAVSFIIKR